MFGPVVWGFKPLIHIHRLVTTDLLTSKLSCLERQDVSQSQPELLEYFFPPCRECARLRVVCYKNSCLSLSLSLSLSPSLSLGVAATTDCEEPSCPLLTLQPIEIIFTSFCISRRVHRTSESLELGEPTTAQMPSLQIAQGHGIHLESGMQQKKVNHRTCLHEDVGKLFTVSKHTSKST